MNEYARLLEQVADQADPTGLPSPTAIRQSSERRRRNTLALAAAASVTVIAVGAIVAGSQTTSTRPTGPIGPTTPTQTADDSASGPASPYGEAVTVEPGLEHFAPNAVTYFAAAGGGSDVYVVVGDTSGTFTGPKPVPPIWWSTDARTWQQASTGPDFNNVWDVTSYGGGMVAVSPRGLRASNAWLSADGDHWIQAQAPDKFHVFNVTSTPAGLFAWGDDRVFTSGGGDEWAEVATPQGLGNVCFVKAEAGRTVLGGLVRDEPAAWVLEDAGWQTTPPPPNPGDNDWCAQAEEAHWTAKGPAATATVRPYEDPLNTVFVKDG